jgi:hypothetical protein
MMFQNQANWLSQARLPVSISIPTIMSSAPLIKDIVPKWRDMPFQRGVIAPQTKPIIINGMPKPRE